MLVLWLLSQLGALALSAGGVRFWARMPQPTTSLAVHEMLVVQVAAAALLFPLLFARRRNTLIAAASIWPMLLLAKMLGDEPTHAVAASGAFVTLWMLALAMLAQIPRSDRARRVAATINLLWTFGGPLLIYLHAEYGSGQAIYPRESIEIWSIIAGPIWAALSHLQNPLVLQWFDAIPAAIVPAVILLQRHRHIKSRQFFHTLSTNILS